MTVNKFNLTEVPKLKREFRYHEDWSFGKGDVIVAVGEKTSKGEFKADHIRPGTGLKDRFKKPPRKEIKR